MKIILGLLGAFAVLVLTFFMYYINVINSEVSLRNQINAQETNLEVYYDKMFKILQQKAGVSTEYKDSFKEIYIGIMEQRYANGDGSLMKWIQESNPNFDASLYKDLMTSIEIERTGFANEQKIMIDLVREHNNMLDMFPSNIFLSGKERIKFVPITSTNSKNIVESRIDDNVELFK